jgi:hypothetical protein
MIKRPLKLQVNGGSRDPKLACRLQAGSSQLIPIRQYKVNIMLKFAD